MFDDLYPALVLQAARPHKYHRNLHYQLEQVQSPRQIRKVFNEVVNLEYDNNVQSDLGMRYGKLLNPPILCNFTRALITARNMAQAAQLIDLPFQSMGNYFYPYVSRTDQGTQFSIVFPFTPNMSAPLQRFSEESTFLYLLNLFHLVYDSAFRPKALHFSFSKPDYWLDYRETFNCPVFFDSPIAIFEIDTCWQNRTFKTADHTAHQIYLLKCQKFWANSAKDAGTIYRVVCYLMKHHPEAFSIRETAEGLNCSISWLQKKLKEKQLTYRDLCKQVRLTLLEVYILIEDKGIEDTAAALGFSGASGLNRFMQKEIGKSYHSFRKTLREKHAHPVFKSTLKRPALLFSSVE